MAKLVADRKAVRERLWKELPNSEIFQEMEESRREYFRKVDLEFPPDGRLIIPGDSPFWEEWFRDYQTQLLNTVRDRSFTTLDQSAYGTLFARWNAIKQELPPPLQQSFVFSLGSKEFFAKVGLHDLRETSDCNVVLSIAAEDMIFASDYASFTSCITTLGDAGDHSRAGGGRIYATTNKTAVLLREQEPTPIDSWKISQNSKYKPMNWPPLEKKVGRRFLMFSGDKIPKKAVVSRPYGVLGWSNLAVFGVLVPKGIAIHGDVSSTRIHPGGMGVYVEQELYVGGNSSFALTLHAMGEHPASWSSEYDCDKKSLCKGCGSRLRRGEGEIFRPRHGDPLLLCSSCIKTAVGECSVCRVKDLKKNLHVGEKEVLFCGDECAKTQNQYACAGCHSYHKKKHLFTPVRFDEENNKIFLSTVCMPCMQKLHLPQCKVCFTFFELPVVTNSDVCPDCYPKTYEQVEIDYDEDDNGLDNSVVMNGR